MTMVKRLFAACVLSLALAAVGVPAHAQDSGPCKADIEKFCAKAEKGQGRVLKCLKEHTDQLSPDCKKVVENRRQAATRQEGRGGKGMRTVCGSEIEKYCKAAKGKRSEMATCLKEHRSDLSTECGEKVDQVMKRIDKKKETPTKS